MKVHMVGLLKDERNVDEGQRMVGKWIRWHLFLENAANNRMLVSLLFSNGTQTAFASYETGF